MMEYLSQNLWVLWSVTAIVCLILELSSGDFFITCFAIGSIFSLITSLLDVPFWGQAFTFATLSILCIFFVRPSLVKWLHRTGEERLSNADALIGREGIVVDSIEKDNPGYVKIDGDEWKAYSRYGKDILKGDKVRVVSRDSIIITVEKLK